MQGIIIKGIGGFYYVKCGEEVIECKARGKFRHNDLTPTVGDLVEISILNGKGSIDKIYERKNQLLRPAVVNVTQAFLIFAIKNPDINVDLLNKFLVLCNYNNIKAIVCLNKMDLQKDDFANEVINMLEKAQYEIIFLKAKEGEGVEKIKEKLHDNVTVFCGPSGVGKSTLLNKVIGQNVMQTGEISEKIGRGKHTTRHSELVEISGGFIVDTPGFSSLELKGIISKSEFKDYFNEFNEYEGMCKFSGCMHFKEPNCAVKDAVDKGYISKMRYDFYVKTLEELNDNNWRNKK